MEKVIAKKLGRILLSITFVLSSSVPVSLAAELQPVHDLTHQREISIEHAQNQSDRRSVPGGTHGLMDKAINNDGGWAIHESANKDKQPVNVACAGGSCKLFHEDGSTETINTGFQERQAEAHNASNEGQEGTRASYSHAQVSESQEGDRPFRQTADYVTINFNQSRQLNHDVLRNERLDGFENVKVKGAQPVGLSGGNAHGEYYWTLTENGSFTLNLYDDFWDHQINDPARIVVYFTIINEDTEEEVLSYVTVYVTDSQVAAHDDVVSVDEDNSVIVNIIENDDWPLTEITEVTQGPQFGTLELEERSLFDGYTGRVKYTPNKDFSGQDSFEYRVCDMAELFCSVATVVINVNPINDAPIARNDGYALVEAGQYYPFNLINGFSDVDNTKDEMTVYDVNAVPPHAVVGGIVRREEGDGPFSYSVTVMPDYVGHIYIHFKVKDPGNKVAEGRLRLDVFNRNIPVAKDDNVLNVDFAAGQDIVIDVLANDFLGIGNLAIVLVDYPKTTQPGASVRVSDDGQRVIYTPPAPGLPFQPYDHFRYVIENEQGHRSEAIVDLRADDGVNVPTPAEPVSPEIPIISDVVDWIQGFMQQYLSSERKREKNAGAEQDRSGNDDPEKYKIYAEYQPAGSAFLTSGEWKKVKIDILTALIEPNGEGILGDLLEPGMDYLFRIVVESRDGAYQAESDVVRIIS